MDFLGLQTVEDPKRERGSNSFATFMVIGRMQDLHFQPC
jgi:hypothetical protein